MSDVVDLGPLIAAGAAGNADPALAATLAASHPIVLLPVRLETRYAGAGAAAGSCSCGSGPTRSTSTPTTLA